ncbi:hypothetical protein ACMT3M_001801, partial [Campylobacter jejuni]
INISDQGPHTIIIQSGGTLGSIGNTGNIIYASTNNGNTLTLANLTNNGTINGKVAIQNSSSNFTGTIAVNTFENKNQINGQIYMGIWGGNSGILTVDQFNNSGTITAFDKNQGVFFEGGANNKSTINNFNNTGVISSTNKEAVQFTHTDVKTITNNGNIKSEGHRGISINNSSVQTLNNSGTIQTSNQNVNNWDTQAIYIGSSTIQT